MFNNFEKRTVRDVLKQVQDDYVEVAGLFSGMICFISVFYYLRKSVPTGRSPSVDGRRLVICG